MVDKLFTLLPFLVACAVAVAAMPTNVYRVNRAAMGTEHGQPWRTKSLAHLERAAARVAAMVRAWCAPPLRGPSAAVAAGALIGVAVFVAADVHSGLSLAIVVLAAPATQLKSLRAQAGELRQQILDLNAIVADGKELTEEQRTSLATLRTKAAAVKEALAIAEEANEDERAAVAATDADADATRRATRGLRVVAGDDRTQHDPKRGFRDHAEQMMCIMRAGQTGRVDPRLVPLAVAGGDEQSGHSDPHGGFLLAPAFSPDILSVPAEVDPTAGRTLSVPMTNSRVVFNARVDKNHTTSVSGGLTVSRTPAAKAATASRMEFEQVELVAHDLVGSAFATNRILRESPSSFIALMQAAFGDEFAAKKLDERLNGTGAGEFAGVINDAATIAVAKETGQTADTILFENVNKMVARCWRYGQSIWLANHDTWPQVTTLYMPIGSAGERVPIYAPGNEDAPFGTLLGRPIFPTEFCRTVGDKGDVVLGNWSQYLEGNYGQMEEARSIHVRFLEREECFLFVEMNDAKPWWRSALTPKYSTQTLSPFVVLAARA